MSISEIKRDETKGPPMATGAPIEDDAPTPTGRTSAGGMFWFVVKAVEIRLRFIAILVCIGLVIGYWDTIRNYWDKWTRPTAASVATGLVGEEY